MIDTFMFVYFIGALSTMLYLMMKIKNAELGFLLTMLWPLVLIHLAYTSATRVIKGGK